MFSGLQIAAAVADRLQEKREGSQDGTAKFAALQHLGRGIKDALPQLRQSIRHCIEVSTYFPGSGQHLWCTRGVQRLGQGLIAAVIHARG